MGFIIHRLRTAFWTVFYRTVGRSLFHRLGRGACFEGWVDIPQKGGKIIIGEQAHLCRLVEFSVPPGGELIVGEKVFIGRGVVISAHCHVAIGRHTLLGEFVSIHDNDHRLDQAGLPVAERGFVVGKLEIGSNCWIGAKAVLVRGSGMQENCVLGAGAVLTGELPAGTTAVGVPAKPVYRASSAEKNTHE